MTKISEKGNFEFFYTGRTYHAKSQDKKTFVAKVVAHKANNAKSLSAADFDSNNAKEATNY